MARLNLNFEPVPEVAPTGAPGNDYFRIQASPEAFGAPVARGFQTLGQGVERTAEEGFNALEFHERTAAQQATNNFITARTSIEYGDPTKSIIGPDGQPMKDTGYFGTVGADALYRQQDTMQAIENARQQGLQGLQSERARQLYDAETRRMYADAQQRISAHADQQQKVWGHTVQGDTANLEMGAFVRSLDTPEMGQHGQAYIRARVQQAQLQFGNDPKIVESTVANAKRDLLEAHVNAMAVKDPANAIKLLDEQKDIAGVKYDDIYNRLRNRSNQQLGDEAAQRALSGARSGNFSVPVNDAIRNAATRYGIDPGSLTRVAQIESGGNPTAATGSYKGLFQVSEAEFQKYGPPGGNIWNPNDNALAAAAKMKAEGDQFARNFGRQPTAFDSYMIHQQGLAGYSSHLANPNAPAWQNMLATGEGRQKGEGWAKAAIWGNIPDQYKAGFGNVNNVTSRDFLDMWQAKFGQGGGVSQFRFPPEETLYGGQGRGAFAVGAFPVPNVASTIKPTAMQHLLDDPALRNNPEAFDQAYRKVTVALNAQEIAENQNAKIKKETNDNAASEWFAKIESGLHTPNFDWVKLSGEITRDGIANQGRLEWQTQRSLLDIARRYSGEEQRIGYGSGFFDAKVRILSPPGTAGHIGSIDDILALPDAAVTMQGQHELVSIFNATKREDQSALQEAKHAAEMGVKLRMVRPEDAGGFIKDIKGEQIFNGKFLPLFNQEYNKWVKDGKDPYEFLRDEKKINGLMELVYPKGERDKDRLDASGGLPPPPAGVNEQGWKSIVTYRPTVNGSVIPQEKWVSALNKLLADPSPQTIAALDNHLADTGFKAMDILRTLNPAAAIAAEKTGKIFFPEAEERPEAFDVTEAARGPEAQRGLMKPPAPAAPIEMPHPVEALSEEFKREQEDPNNPAIRLRNWIRMGLHPETVKEKRHPEDVR